MVPDAADSLDALVVSGVVRELPAHLADVDVNAAVERIERAAEYHATCCRASRVTTRPAAESSVCSQIELDGRQIDEGVVAGAVRAGGRVDRDVADRYRDGSVSCSRGCMRRSTARIRAVSSRELKGLGR